MDPRRALDRAPGRPAGGGGGLSESAACWCELKPARDFAHSFDAVRAREYCPWTPTDDGFFAAIVELRVGGGAPRRGGDQKTWQRRFALTTSFSAPTLDPSAPLWLSPDRRRGVGEPSRRGTRWYAGTRPEGSAAREPRLRRRGLFSRKFQSRKPRLVEPCSAPCYPRTFKFYITYA